jgi:hypothetical protein
VLLKALVSQWRRAQAEQSSIHFDSFCTSISVGLSPTFCQTVASDVRHLSYATAYDVRGTRAVSRNHYRRYTATRLGRQL